MLEPEFDVVGICAEGPALVQAATELQLVGVILSISLPRLDALNAAILESPWVHARLLAGILRHRDLQIEMHGIASQGLA